MVFKKCTPDIVRAYIRFHAPQAVRHGKDTAGLVERLAKEAKVSTRTIYRLLKKPLVSENDQMKTRGRKRKLTERTEHRLIRNIAKIRKTNKNWTSKDLMRMTDITQVSIRSIQRILNRNGYYHLTARKKGVVSTADCQKRMRFAKAFRDKPKTFWEEGIAFYFDGVGFLHKTDPYAHAMELRKLVWRKHKEGLHPDCTAKGSKVGYGGKQAKFFVAISYNKEVILAERYDHLCGESFAKFVRTHFRKTFKNSGKQSKVWLQDGDPSQNSKKSKIAQVKVGSELFPIPARSPELNPIENVFAFVKQHLDDEAIEKNITRELFEEYCRRVRTMLLSTSVDRINKIIDSYGKRLRLIIAKKGARINY